MMAIPKVQIAAVIPKTGAAIEIREDYPAKQPEELQPGECLVKMHCSGVCHTGSSATISRYSSSDQFSSRFAREEGRLAHLWRHVRVHLTVGDVTLLIFPQSPDRWPRRCRRDHRHRQAHSGLSCKGRRPSRHQMACLLLSPMRICAFSLFVSELLSLFTYLTSIFQCRKGLEQGTGYAAFRSGPELTIPAPSQIALTSKIVVSVSMEHFPNTSYGPFCSVSRFLASDNLISQVSWVNRV